MSAHIDQRYEELVDRLRSNYNLASIGGLLHWDQQVNLPPEGAESRSRQVEALSSAVHERSTDPELGELIYELRSNFDELEFDQQVVVREAQRNYEQSKRLPDEFVKEKAKASSEGYQVWVEARENDDFEQFKPYLEKNVDLARREAEYLGWEDSPYDALIDQYDPGMTEAKLEEIFTDLRERLIPVADEITSSDREPRTEELITSKHWPEAAQREFGKKVVDQFGFDFEAGRLDTAVHPFCSGTYGDTRLTTRYYEDDPRAALFGIMHESGHGLYSQGLDRETWGTPLSSAVGMAVHESQSRMFENQVGRSRSFWQWAWPIFREHFPEQTEGVGLDEFFFCVNEVEPGYIRVEADEVTYNQHIILRFELERKLIKGEIEVEDLPGLWEQKMDELLGVVPPNDTKGVMQDVHWSQGQFGYFPSYAVGNLLAAQLFEAADEEVGPLDEQFANGEFEPLLNWLRKNVHLQGKRYLTWELIERATGEEPSADAFLDHLKQDYLPLYRRAGSESA